MVGASEDNGPAEAGGFPGKPNITFELKLAPFEVCPVCQWPVTSEFQRDRFASEEPDLASGDLVGFLEKSGLAVLGNDTEKLRAGRERE
jgi:hypothetical protein